MFVQTVSILKSCWKENFLRKKKTLKLHWLHINGHGHWDVWTLSLEKCLYLIEKWKFFAKWKEGKRKIKQNVRQILQCRKKEGEKMDLTMRLALVTSPSLDNLSQELSSAPFSETNLRFLILHCHHPALPESALRVCNLSLHLNLARFAKNNCFLISN